MGIRTKLAAGAGAVGAAAGSFTFLTGLRSEAAFSRPHVEISPVGERYHVLVSAENLGPDVAQSVRAIVRVRGANSGEDQFLDDRARRIAAGETMEVETNGLKFSPERIDACIAYSSAPFVREDWRLFQGGPGGLKRTEEGSATPGADCRALLRTRAR